MTSVVSTSDRTAAMLAARYTDTLFVSIPDSSPFTPQGIATVLNYIPKGSDICALADAVKAELGMDDKAAFQQALTNKIIAHISKVPGFVAQAQTPSGSTSVINARNDGMQHLRY